jgi:hypothetical protein
MKTNITLLRGNAAAPGLQVSRANDLKQYHRFERYGDAPVPRVRARPTLQMIWRVHPTSGWLECRWAVDRGALSDEGVSCSTLLRQAA